KSQRQRERALADFEAWRVDTLVATDVAARGIDVEGISHVINFDAPEDREGYVHRIGRTARAGNTGVGVTFVGAEQARDVRKIATELRLEDQFDASGLHVAQPSRRHVSGGGEARRGRPSGRGRKPSGSGHR
ncbi:MAG: ATP-dependent RNA helicase RhlE, partial [uncultured Solirubrobacteraceae bacterium]